MVGADAAICEMLSHFVAVGAKTYVVKTMIVSMVRFDLYAMSARELFVSVLQLQRCFACGTANQVVVKKI